MSVRPFSSDEQHQAWLNRLGLLARVERIGAKCFPSLEDAAIAAVRAEYSRRYCMEDRSWKDMKLTSSQTSHRNGYLHLVNFCVSENNAELGGENVLPMTAVVYRLAPGKFMSCDQLGAGRDWDYWEDKFTPSLELIKTQFKMYDVDGNGLIEESELRNILRRIDPDRWTAERSRRVLCLVDKNEDNCINFDEFIDWVFDVNGSSDPNFLNAADKAVAVVPSRLVSISQPFESD
mmetsp:Transcript_110134/g.174047  ORF Transcript_110134/g.174047 Transcript_110134/m.174047 type:complete len:234 (+) Transcript_110134:65-766(+)